MDKYQKLAEAFQNPPADYRSLPFWAWNDRLNPQELTTQIADMADHGMGGFFIHSREGLETPYLGEEWMACVRAAVDAAQQNGVKAWLYDEDRWPSGAAGGRVPAAGGDACRAKSITIEVVAPGRAAPAEIPGESVKAAFAAVLSGGELLSYRRISTPQSPREPGETILVFRREVSGPSEWFNNDAPADNLNPDSVKLLIQTTYEAYRRDVGNRFGGAVAGIFTDEPNIADGNCAFTGKRGWVPWTDGLNDEFAAKRGYDLFDHLPLLFFAGEGGGRVRHDYWRTVSERFCEAYSKQLGDWCGRNDLRFTGHYLVENELGASIRVSGCIMPHYRYQHVPGIDLLREQDDEILTVKQCASVARQYGRKHVLSEFYACIGWNLDFESQKWVGDWQYALGVTLRCQHLAMYSLRGCRKRDYALSFNYQTSWWKYDRLMEDYFARLSLMLTQGDALRDVLILHPLTTAWMMMGADPSRTGGWFDEENIRTVDAYGRGFSAILQRFLDEHHDFDLGDETILAEQGAAESGLLRVGCATYRAVVVPPVQTMFASTVALLARALDAGVRVIVIGEPPAKVEGVPDEGIQALFARADVRYAADAGAACGLLDRLLPRRVGMTDERGNQTPGLWYMLRRDGDRRILFVANRRRDVSVRTQVRLPGGGAAEAWDLLGGGAKPVAATREGGELCFPLELGAAESALFVIRDGDTPCIREPRYAARVAAVLRAPFAVHAAQENALVLDVCQYRVSRENAQWSPWSAPMEIWQAQRGIRQTLGMRPIFYNGLPQRYQWVNEPHPHDGAGAELRLEFTVETVPAGGVSLALESAADFTLLLNGKTIPCTPSGWYLDRSFAKIPLPAPQAGRNQLVLRCAYRNATELENAYLLGDFSVDAHRRIAAPVRELRPGDWGAQGFPHYCGGLVYQSRFTLPEPGGGKCFLAPGAWKGAVVSVRVNGHAAGLIPWKAVEKLEITGCVQAGENTVEIEVTGTPRNLLGPFHDRTRNTNVSWECFRTEGDAYTAEYILVPNGLMECPRILIEAEGGETV